MRKGYQSPYRERKYFTQSIPMDELSLDESGNFHQEFLKKYNEFVMKEKLSIDKVLCVPMEDGVEECYFDFSYLYMDALDEIWILPELQMPVEDAGDNELAKERREEFVKLRNEEMYHFEQYHRKKKAEELRAYLNRRKLVCNWLGDI